MAIVRCAFGPTTGAQVNTFRFNTEAKSLINIRCRDLIHDGVHYLTWALVYGDGPLAKVHSTRSYSVIATGFRIDQTGSQVGGIDIGITWHVPDRLYQRCLRPTPHYAHTANRSCVAHMATEQTDD